MENSPPKATGRKRDRDAQRNHLSDALGLPVERRGDDSTIHREVRPSVPEGLGRYPHCHESADAAMGKARLGGMRLDGIRQTEAFAADH